MIALNLSNVLHLLTFPHHLHRHATASSVKPNSLDDDSPSLESARSATPSTHHHTLQNFKFVVTSFTYWKVAGSIRFFVSIKGREK